MRRFRIVAVLAALIATTLIAAEAAPAYADSAGPYSRVRFFHAPKCLTVPNSTANGVQMVQWNCDGFANGTWYFDWTDNGWAKLRSVYSQKCLTVFNGSVQNSPVMQWNCDGFANGQWKGTKVGWATIDGAARDLYELKNRETSLCLNAQGANNLNGSGMILWPCGPIAPNTWNANMLVTWY